MKTLQKWLSGLGQEYTLDELSNLKRLNLSNNQLACIPKEIGLLSNLELLWLGCNPNLVIFEDQVEFISNIRHSTRIIKVVPRNANTDILFG
jgi:Leucine-rich repeat (LRR) protein